MLPQVYALTEGGVPVLRYIFIPKKISVVFKDSGFHLPSTWIIFILSLYLRSQIGNLYKIVDFDHSVEEFSLSGPSVGLTCFENWEDNPRGRSGPRYRALHCPEPQGGASKGHRKIFYLANYLDEFRTKGKSMLFSRAGVTRLEKGISFVFFTFTIRPFSVQYFCKMKSFGFNTSPSMRILLDYSHIKVSGCPKGYLY